MCRFEKKYDAAILSVQEYLKIIKKQIKMNKTEFVVYKLCCKNCDASYVGQTSRQLKTRISEHRNHINRIPHSP